MASTSSSQDISRIDLNVELIYKLAVFSIYSINVEQLGELV
jgi:hypothetical protein